MRAIGVHTTGGPEQLQVLDLPEPEVGPGEVRIAVHAAAVNPTDTVLRAGMAVPEDLSPPYVPGMDAAGVIDAIGEGVEFAVGDRVAAIVNPRTAPGGAYAEKVVVPEASVARVPEGIDLVDAASFPLNVLTARRAMELLDLPEHGTLAVTGAAGAVGGYAIELAVHAGYRVVADAKEDDRELVTSLGAATVLERGETFPGAVYEAEPGGVDGLLDAAVMGAPVLAAVRDGGVVVAVRRFEGEAERQIRIYHVTPDDYLRDGAALERLFTLVKQGALTLRVARTYPAEDAAQAHRDLEAGGVRGRLVLTF